MSLSNSQINRAGRILRASWKEPGRALLGENETWALHVLDEFRAAHAQPLLKANNGLRSMIRTEGCEISVSQRLKRRTTIIDKLVRQPTMALSKMQDIAGCRAVLANIEEVRRVQNRVAASRAPIRIDDYIAHPRPSGYRAVHLVIKYDDRYVEIQLRTRLMHEWAVAVERLGGRIDSDLKSSQGPPEVLRWLTAVSEAMAIEDEGGTADTMVMDHIRALRRDAAGFFPKDSK